MQFWRWIALIGALAVAGCSPVQPFGAPAAATSSGAADPAVASYLDSMGQIRQQMGDSLDRVNGLMGNADPENGAWHQQVSTEMALWQKLYQQARALNPPPQLATPHATFMQAMASYDSASRDISTALGTTDTNKLVAAKQELQTAQQQMVQSNQQLRTALGQ